jgi:hypothetical protein
VVKTSLARSKDTCDETGDESSGSIQGSGEESDEENKTTALHHDAQLVVEATNYQ